MRIIFVRHGHPNYKDDCLTELGHMQAAAAAQRLCNEGIEKIYSSSCGRAAETAEHIGEKIGLSVEKCDFMREIGWGTAVGELLPDGGHPWKAADNMFAAGESIVDTDWYQKEPFVRNKVTAYVKKVGEEFDNWLYSLGFEREGDFYRVHTQKYKTVVMASHGGSSSAAISHLFNLSFPFACVALRASFTGITVVDLSGSEGSLISPRFELFNDARHIEGLETENVYER